MRQVGNFLYDLSQSLTESSVQYFFIQGRHPDLKLMTMPVIVEDQVKDPLLLSRHQVGETLWNWNQVHQEVWGFNYRNLVETDSP